MASVGVTVEPGRGVAVSPGGGSGVARREEPVLSVALAGTFASSRAAQVLNPVEDEVGVGGPKDGAEDADPTLAKIKAGTNDVNHPSAPEIQQEVNKVTKPTLPELNELNEASKMVLPSNIFMGPEETDRCKPF